MSYNVKSFVTQAREAGWFDDDPPAPDDFSWTGPEDEDAPPVEVTHAAAKDIDGPMPCCGLTCWEVPSFDAVSENPSAVTCRQREAVFFDAARHEAEHRLSSRMERG